MFESLVFRLTCKLQAYIFFDTGWNGCLDDRWVHFYLPLGWSKTGGKKKSPPEAWKKNTTNCRVSPRKRVSSPWLGRLRQRLREMIPHPGMRIEAGQAKSMGRADSQRPERPASPSPCLHCCHCLLASSCPCRRGTSSSARPSPPQAPAPPRSESPASHLRPTTNPSCCFSDGEI